ncbi:deoxyribodipyrimidine photo-lyase [Polynucleobacter sp. SHI8]|uniref:cryptochrome/photolyase family protein n=1 Tax=unclassified Polynucleobacter TaxID=2640945 RepID=UPI002490E713|nr:MULTISPECIES: deoxyribodipyrimidine photo-lyase [unclassified Polynucleobacter]BDW10183.1 deoxyribodipyrimidine photo-lyase [Polynucleobacter sp. SHI2]BDW12629.1 deoxyribodipyrimidine photo-lyase [Polynucleobacter sp. SHI8]
MKLGLVWLRRDLRLFDSQAIFQALKACDQVFLCFVYDTTILTPLLDKGFTHDRRVDFIWQSVQELHSELLKMNPSAGMIQLHGDPQVLIPELAKTLQVSEVYTNHDYEPVAQVRDHTVAASLQKLGIEFSSYKDQVIFEKHEVLSKEGNVYSVFTPYKNAWLKKLSDADLAPFSCFLDQKSFGQLAPIPAKLLAQVTLSQMGFSPSGIESFIQPGMTGASIAFENFVERMHQYHISRDFPSIKGPSYLSTHLRFGTISIRALVRDAHLQMLAGSMGATIWLSELIWRDFYFMILANHPRLASGASFKPDYDKIVWDKDATAEKHFQAWCSGKTGYPIVDAAMRQLNSTGYMHNRLRMVAACFLIKDLGIDWRRGEAYFADTLNDFDFSANNGGWQWAASSGCDAQPYFRIFNPITQSQKFDTEGKFIRRYCPELSALSNKSIHAPWQAGAIELEAANIRLGSDYPLPIVDHGEARLATLLRYGVVKSSPVKET